MMSIYHVKTGEISWGGHTRGKGYSGHGRGLNNPDFENVKGVGPIPEGLWAINQWEAHHSGLGPWVTHLTPVKVTKQYGRSAFFIHGDNAEVDFTASDGCIILDHNLREALRQSGCNQILVVHD